MQKLRLMGTALPWRKSVKYLGLTIDSKLTWSPAVKALRKEMNRTASCARRFLAQGMGASPALCLRLYEAIAISKALYALPPCKPQASTVE